MKVEIECIACGNVKQFHEMCLSIKCTHVVDFLLKFIVKEIWHTALNLILLLI